MKYLHSRLEGERLEDITVCHLNNNVYFSGYQKVICNIGNFENPKKLFNIQLP